MIFFRPIKSFFVVVVFNRKSTSSPQITFCPMSHHSTTADDVCRQIFVKMCKFIRPLKAFVAIFILLCHSTNSNAKNCKNSRPLCRDGKENFIEGRSRTDHAVVVKHIRGTAYAADHSPSCYDKRPTVLMPGIAKLIGGEVTVPPNNYDLIKSGTLKLTVTNPNFDDPLCLNGVSQYLALPSSFCNVVLCDFIGRDLCEFLQQPGTHTIREMEQKIGFNSTLVLPEAPSILGISLLDLFAGEFHFVFALETDGEVIMDLEIPANMPFVPLGLQEDNEDEESC